MKILCSTVLLIVVVCSSWAEEQYRVFTSVDGREIEARIVEYDTDRGRVKIERRGGKAVWVTPGMFAETDQIYLKAWIAGTQFREKRNLSLSLNKKKGKKSEPRIKTSSGEKRELQKVYFELSLKNRMQQAITINRIEYRYYVDRKGLGPASGKSELIEHGGAVPFGSLGPREARVRKIPSYTLENRSRESMDASTDSYGGITRSLTITKTREEDLRGVWIRLHGPEIDGQPNFRDITYPSDLAEQVSWTPPPINEQSTGK